MKKSDRFYYQAFGLQLESDLDCYPLPAGNGATPDVRILLRDVPDRLSDPRVCGFKYEGQPGRILLKTVHIADILVEKGSLIRLEPKATATPAEVRLLLLGWAMGALFHQRGLLPLHGSVIKKNRGCVVFSGDSGQGKSTLVAHLIARGYAFLDDNIAVLDPQGDPELKVQPGFPEVKLWKHALDNLGLNPADLTLLTPRKEKFAAVFSEAFCDIPLPLKKVCVLRRGTGTRLSIKEIRGQEKFRMLRDHTFCFRYLDAMGLTKNHFSLVSRLAGSAEVVMVEWPAKERLDPRDVDRVERELL